MTDNTRALLEQALESLWQMTKKFNFERLHESRLSDSKVRVAAHDAMNAIRAELAKPADIADEMSAVADQFAHRLALDLECVLADYSGTWYDAAISTLGAYRDAMNAIHERESPTFMGEPVLSSEELANREKTSGSPIEDYSDCHGPDWTGRDGEYLK